MKNVDIKYRPYKVRNYSSFKIMFLSAISYKY